MLLRRKKRIVQPGGPVPLPRAALSEAEAIITPNEPNERHGIGIIVERFFGAAPNTLSIRSHDNFGGEQNFGTKKLRLTHAGLARWESYERLLQALNGSTIRRIVCIPFLPDDLITAICARELFQAPLCIYVMDDNNIGAHGIPDYLFQEALSKASLRLGISPEIRDAYQKKFGAPFHVLPPLIERSLLQPHPLQPDPAAPAVLIGNVWSQQWLERLRGALRDSGIQVHWFGNTNATWLKYSPTDLKRDGITIRGFLPESELIAELRRAPFALIPSGSLDEHDDRPELARLSLPSRIPYLAGAANLPLIVLGSPDTSAGRFVTNFGIGLVCPYARDALRAAAREISTPEKQRALRQNAVRMGEALTLPSAGDWIWNSLNLGKPIDDKFDRLMPPGV